MKSYRIKELAAALTIGSLCLAAAELAWTAEATRGGAHPNLVLWDTISPLGDRLNPDDRPQWKAVPNDLLLLEKDPPKASSDPGYYGRDYSFTGDAVVETPLVSAVFRSAKGCVSLYSRQVSSQQDEPSEAAKWPGVKTVDIAPVTGGTGLTTISHLEVVRNADDEVLLSASFFSRDQPAVVAVFSLDKTGTLGIKPGQNFERVRLSGPMEYGVVPAFVGDDLIYGGPERAATNVFGIPSENLFLGLLEGENTELVITWPRGKQRVNLQFGEENGKPMLRSVDFDSDSQSLYVTPLSAPGIWHKETLKPENLERDVRIQWKRPFPAKWKTQLYEEDLKTTFAFRASRGQIWRGVAGSYLYPVWFSVEAAYYFLGKKVQPKGELIVYCLEGRATPTTIPTPADILKQTLGRQAAEPILDLAGRKLRTHHRRGGTGVRRACTCGCTEAIQAVFEAGEEVDQKDYIQGALDDMVFFVHRHVERINEYQQFADSLLKRIQELERSNPDLKGFLDSLEEITRQIPQECEVQKENMKTFDYADSLSRKTMVLTARKDPGNLKAYMELLKAWREMGGAQDFVVAKCHTVTRNLSQAAGYGCAAQPDAVPVAEEIRARCRQVLRNPDGYEIWADY